MPRTFTALSDMIGHGFDTVIDVRSPAEFAIDHLPGAINLPALSNTERAEVGTVYTQVSAFNARKIGAAMVARNVATHLDGPLKGYDGAWRPLVYCWRGGQRSGAFAAILTQIGWRAETITGGYQTYRRLVYDALYNVPIKHKLILLDGYTGTAKTQLLHLLDQRGVQVLDLEGFAHHRGSLLGGFPDGQPAQKWFESCVATGLARMDPARPVVIEAESSKIGKIVLPPSLWSAMTAAPRIEVTAPLAARATYLTQAYADMIVDPAAARKRLQPLRHLRGHAIVDRWEGHFTSGDYHTLAMQLMTDHYDPAYARSRGSHDFDLLGQVHTETLDATGQNHAADAIAQLISSAPLSHPHPR